MQWLFFQPVCSNYELCVVIIQMACHLASVCVHMCVQVCVYISLLSEEVQL